MQQNDIEYKTLKKYENELIECLVSVGLFLLTAGLPSLTFSCESQGLGAFLKVSKDFSICLTGTGGLWWWCGGGGVKMLVASPFSHIRNKGLNV